MIGGEMELNEFLSLKHILQKINKQTKNTKKISSKKVKNNKKPVIYTMDA